MNNELTQPCCNLTNIMDNHENNFNITGSTVNFNMQMNQNTNPSDGEKMIAVQRFSNEYYQLIVTSQDDIFKTNTVLVHDSRALTKGNTPFEIFQECSTLSDEGKNKLLTIPAIICQESKNPYGEPDSMQFAMYAYIQKIKKMGKEIAIAFQPIYPFPQALLADKRGSIFFDINIGCYVSDLNHSAWSVHKVNLFEAFNEVGLNNLPRPLPLPK